MPLLAGRRSRGRGEVAFALVRVGGLLNAVLLALLLAVVAVIGVEGGARVLGVLLAVGRRGVGVAACWFQPCWYCCWS